jgi:trans-aconitate methyltransferase
MNTRVERLLEQPIVYRLWMAPFAEQKLRPVKQNGGVHGVRRVLDVGCGPGTNASHFAHTDYLGMDINPEYIESARQRNSTGKFMVQDVTTFSATPDERFDSILVNSLLHHIPTPEVERLLSHLATLLSDDGAIHIIEVVLPPNVGAPWALAKLDRGDYPRPFEEWQRIFAKYFQPVVSEPHPIKGLGITLWDMIYFKGRCR